MRRLAQLTRLNQKTVHRAYSRLAHEGWLEVRPGSGTFIAECLPGEGPVSVARLGTVVAGLREALVDTGLSGREFAGFVDRLMNRGLGDRRLVVTECNGEQLGIIARTVSRSIGAEVVPMHLECLTPAAVEDCHGVVTSECHRADVVRVLGRSEIPVHTLVFDSRFPRNVLTAALSGPVVLIVDDASFGPMFLEFLGRLGGTSSVRARVQVCGVEEARTRLASRYLPPATVGVSPLVPDPNRLHLDGHRVIEFWDVAAESARDLEIRLAYDSARQARSE